jgi:uncharacterized protein with LGFP repeats
MAVELVQVDVRGRRIPAARVGGRGDLAAAAAGLGLAPSPVLVLVGGAADMSAYDRHSVERALADAVVPVAERVGATVVDGATRVGVMRLAGEVRAQIGAGFPLVGVVAAELVTETELDENHTHFVLVPGEEWGDESELLAALATTVARGEPTVTILANGGVVAWRDAESSVAEGRRVIVLEGSGRTADELAAAETSRAKDLHDSRLLTVVAVTDAAALATAVAAAFAESA